MASTVDTAIIRMGFDAKDVNRGISQVQSKLGGLDSQIRKVGTGGSSGLDRVQKDAMKAANAVGYLRSQLSSLQGVFGPLAEAFTIGLSAPLALVGKSAFDAYKNLDNVTRGLEAILGSKALAVTTIEQLRNVAKQPGLDFESTIQGYRRLVAAGADTRLASDALKEFGNALALVGGSSEDLAGVTLALQQILSKTKVSAEEINQIAERIPSVRKLIIQAFGTADTEELQKRGIIPKDFVKAIVREAQSLPRATSSISNELKNAKDELFRTLTEIGADISGLLLPYIKNGVQTLKEFGQAFRDLDPSTRQLIVKIGLIAAAIGPLLYTLNLVRGAAEALSKTYTFFTGLITTLIPKHAAETAAITAKSLAYDKLAVSVGRAATAEAGGAVGGAASAVFAGVPTAGRTAGQARAAEGTAEILAAKEAALRKLSQRKLAQLSEKLNEVATKERTLSELSATVASGSGTTADAYALVNKTVNKKKEVDALKSSAAALSKEITELTGRQKVLNIVMNGAKAPAAEAAVPLLRLGTILPRIGSLLPKVAAGFGGLGASIAVGGVIEGFGKSLVSTLGGFDGIIKSLKGMVLVGKDLATSFFKPITDFASFAFDAAAKKYESFVDIVAKKSKELLDSSVSVQFYANMFKFFAQYYDAEKLATENAKALPNIIGKFAPKLSPEAEAGLKIKPLEDQQAKREADKKAAEAVLRAESNLTKQLRKAQADYNYELDSENKERKYQVEYERILKDRAAERADLARDLGSAFTEVNQKLFDETTLTLVAVARQHDYNKVIEEGKKLLQDRADEEQKRIAELVEARRKANEEVFKDADKLDENRGKQAREFIQTQAGLKRDAALAQIDAETAYTVEQKQVAELKKAQIETKYIAEIAYYKEQESKIELNRELARYKALLDAKIISEQAFERIKVASELLSQQEIDQIRQKRDADVARTRIEAEAKITQIARDEDLKRFQSVKDGAGRIFDALLLKTESFGDAVKNILKTAFLTPIREFAATLTATMLTGVNPQGQRAAGGNSGIQGVFNTALGGLFGGGGGQGGSGSGGSGGSRGFGGLGGILGGGFGGFGGMRVPIATGTTGGVIFSDGSSTGGLPGIASRMPFGMPDIQMGPSTSGSGPGQLTGLAGAKAQGLEFLTRLGNLGATNKLFSKGVYGAKGGALLAGGGILAFDGLRRGGLVGLAETTAGGAMIGAKFGGPIGALIGGAIGATAGFIRLMFKGADQKLRQKIKNVWGIDVPDKGVLKQILGITKQSFGGNTDLAVRSPQVRELLELYAMSTGQPFGGLLDTKTPRAVNLAQQGGTIFQAGTSINGSNFGVQSAFQSLGGQSIQMFPQQSNQPINISFSLDGRATTDVLDGRVVNTSSSMRGAAYEPGTVLP